MTYTAARTQSEATNIFLYMDFSLFSISHPLFYVLKMSACAAVKSDCVSG